MSQTQMLRVLRILRLFRLFRLLRLLKLQELDLATKVPFILIELTGEGHGQGEIEVWWSEKQNAEKFYHASCGMSEAGASADAPLRRGGVRLSPYRAFVAPILAARPNLSSSLNPSRPSKMPTRPCCASAPLSRPWR